MLFNFFRERPPGVNVTQANSEPGGNLNITVRGAGSINSSNNVLVIIDGLPGGSTAIINPADIESIEILKDASAAAIYGTRAANGVLLIKLKRAKKEQQRFLIILTSRTKHRLTRSMS